MLTKNRHLALIAALGTAIGGPALAQTTAEPAPEATVIETPANETVVAPAPAVTADSPVGTAVESDFPRFDQLANDEMIAETLLAQGFADVKILREGSLMTVTAKRDGDDIELVYNLVEGRLIYVNGERILTEDQLNADDTPGTGEAAEGGGTDGATEGSAPDDGATDDGATDDSATDDGTTEDGVTGDVSTEDGATDDGMAGGDGATDAAGDGADTGGSVTDGAETDGAETGGGDADTGSDSSGAAAGG